MSTQKISVRLDEEVLASIDRYRASRRWSRTTVLEAALEAFLDDTTRGVPDPPATLAATMAREIGTARRDDRAFVNRALPPLDPRGSKPQRESFASGAEWQAALGEWRGKHGR